MLLGDLLLDARRAAVLLDAALLGHIEATGQSPEAFARSAVVSFERTASAEEWTSLLSRLQQSEDPGGVCLDMMVRRYLLALQHRAHADSHEET